MPSKSLLLVWTIAVGVAAVLWSGLAIAQQSPWALTQGVNASDSIDHANGYDYISFSVIDTDAPSSTYSSLSSGSARSVTYDPPGAENYYYCTQSYPLQEAVDRIADDSGAIAPNKSFSYSITLPACNVYPAATFTVQCDAVETIHFSESGGTKETRPDGSKTFLSFEKEELKAFLDVGVNDFTCSLTFDNGIVSLTSNYAFMSAYDYRGREK